MAPLKRAIDGLTKTPRDLAADAGAGVISQLSDYATGSSSTTHTSTDTTPTPQTQDDNDNPKAPPHPCIITGLGDCGDDPPDCADIAASRGFAGGPGEWKFETFTVKDSPGRYQEHVTDMPRHCHYVVGGAEYDGYQPGRLLEAKGYYDFIDWVDYDWRKTERQMRRQANGSARTGTALEWHILTERSRELFKARASDLDPPLAMAIDFRWDPM